MHARTHTHTHTHRHRSTTHRSHACTLARTHAGTHELTHMRLTTFVHIASLQKPYVYPCSPRKGCFVQVATLDRLEKGFFIPPSRPLSLTPFQWHLISKMYGLRTENVFYSAKAHFVYIRPPRRLATGNPKQYPTKPGQHPAP
eukprot:15462457-Alexandrium_andersonii.AAC.1